MLRSRRHTLPPSGLYDVDPSRPLNAEWAPNRGLVGLWLPIPSLAGGGQLFDLSGYAGHGTLSGMDPASDWVATERGLALDFAAGSELVTGALSRPISPPATLSWWVYCRDSVWNGMLTFSDDDDSDWWNFFWNGAASGFTAQSRGSGDTNPNTGTIPGENQWVHLLFTEDEAGHFDGYANGTRVFSSVYAKSPTVDRFRIGDNEAGAQTGYDGRLTDLRLWNRVLSDTERNAVYEDALLGYPNTLRRTRRQWPGAVATETASISGAAGLAFSASGALGGRGAFSGTAVASFLASATLRPKGEVYLEAGGVYVPGAQSGHVDLPGALAGQTFTPGALAGQVAA